MFALRFRVSEAILGDLCRNVGVWEEILGFVRRFLGSEAVLGS